MESKENNGALNIFNFLSNGLWLTFLFTREPHIKGVSDLYSK